MIKAMFGHRKQIVVAGLACVAVCTPQVTMAESPPGPPIVFFDWDSEDLTPEARVILNLVLPTYKRVSARGITIKANADRSGTEAYNVALTHRRAKAVANYLQTRGLSEDGITIEALGETQPLSNTPDGAREPQNRYAYIVFEMTDHEVE